jgi:hypothetical protein
MIEPRADHADLLGGNRTSPPRSGDRVARCSAFYRELGSAMGGWRGTHNENVVPVSAVDSTAIRPWCASTR